jgi:hypothetical protein
MKIDNSALADVVERCFDLSMDGRLEQAQRQEFLVLGKRLRGSLVNVLSASFDADNEDFKAAQDKLKAVGTSIQSAQQALEGTTKVLAQLDGLVSALDGLLKFATFV